MLARKRIWVLCAGAGVLALLIALLISGIGAVPDLHVTPLGYENKIFHQDRIHSINICMDDWMGFLATCEDETYTNCTVVINEETFENVGIRTQGNSSLTNLAEMGSCRYSLKLEFDYYDSEQRYHGLDKLNLNNLIHDNTMMKDYLAYRMMNELGTPAPLCSYTCVYINGKSLGLYLAVEDIGESFLQRNYGSAYGELYQPSPSVDGEPPRDVNLQYIDDDPDSYPNLFENAKTDLTPEDKTRLIQSLKQLSTGKKLKNAVDIEAVTRYFAVHTFVCNESSDTGSTVHHYYLHEKDGKLAMLPWDYHLAFGGISNATAASVVNSSIYTPVADRPMLAWILEDKNYTWLYERYHLEVRNIDTETLIEQTATMLAPYVLRDPTRFCTYEEFEAGVEALQQFLDLRTESIRLQLQGKPPHVDVGDLDLSDMGGISVPASPASQ